MKRQLRLLLTITALLIMNSEQICAQGEMALIIKDKVNLRYAPSAKGKVQCHVYKGIMLEMTGKENEWIKVKNFQDETAYVNASLVKILKPSLLPDSFFKDNSYNPYGGQLDDIRIDGALSISVKGKYVLLSTMWMRYDVKNDRFLPAEYNDIIAVRNAGKLIMKYDVNTLNFNEWNPEVVSIEKLLSNGDISLIEGSDNVVFYNDGMKLLRIRHMAYKVGEPIE